MMLLKSSIHFAFIAKFLPAFVIKPKVFTVQT